MTHMSHIKTLQNEIEHLRNENNEQSQIMSQLQLELNERKRQYEQRLEEQIKHLDNAFISQQEKILAELSEKDSRIADLEMDRTSSGASNRVNTIEKLNTEKQQLHNQLKELTEIRMKIIQDHMASKQEYDDKEKLVSFSPILDMPRIAILHPDLGIGGAERLIVDIGLALKFHRHDVDIYTNFHDRQRCFDETRNGQLSVFVACSWFPRNIFGRFHALCAYIRFILLAIYVVYIESKHKHYDVFVCDQISACIPVLKRTERPILFYCHYPDQLLAKRESIAKKIYRWPIDVFEVYTTCLADCILVNSAYTKSIFEKYISSKIPVDILYPTIPDRLLSSFSNENERAINFLSINRFERKKDLSLALHSFAYLRKLLNSNSKPIHLYIIGGYDERLRENVEYYQELVELANQLNIDSSLITFVRSFSDEQKCEYLSKAHCILYTPRFEHFGIVPLEAMQAGRPVIATSTGGPLETIIDNQTGFLCDEPLIETFAQRMKKFIDNENLSKQMGEQGKTHVNEKFSFKPFAKKLNEHINEILIRHNNTKNTSLLLFIFAFFMREVIYMTSLELHKSLDNIEKIRHRSYLTDALISAYELDKHNHIRFIQPQLATDNELASAHDRDYIEFLSFISNIDPDDEKLYREQMDVYKIGYECPPFEQLSSFCKWIGGGSITAARYLNRSSNNIAINFFGGWHHAKRSEASGFCYINDIVMAINELRKKFDRICYIDLDLHHGDGIQEAFYCSSKVLTVSLHKYEPGFFPINSGGLNEIGEAWGRGFNINIPLHHGINDNQYLSLFTSLVPKINSSFQPEVFVVQCGADTLFGDPMKSFNLTTKCIMNCVEQIINLNKPILLLGGGGYNIADTARLWTSITSLCLNEKLDNDIPEHEYFVYYGPDFTLETWPGNRTNKNTQEYIEGLLNFVEHNQINIMNSQIL
ncbi:unnamed protein product [Rotaria magnacalcarata]|uniref:GDP-Man:Man(1)GlcNAc(2)-PP-Dol alpha-1,3-mannosyltransferase n=1 Tax=Rotaria magnacalcarata TaxID=392030 RepID=A0A819S490_9BILA|nr:unnamed protein product [Rotaria magnacalcarata]